MEFLNYVETVIVPQLEKLEKGRKESLEKIGITDIEMSKKKLINSFIAVFVIFFVFVLIVFWATGQLGSNKITFIIFAVIFWQLFKARKSSSALGDYIFKNYLNQTVAGHEYRMQYKSDVIRLILDYFNTRFEYFPKKRIHKNDFDKSKLFLVHSDNIRGEDCFAGDYGKNHLVFSELAIQFPSNNDRQVIKNYLFLISDFPKEFSGNTIVVPEKKTGVDTSSDFKVFQSEFHRKDIGQLVKLEDTEFEKYFSVYSSDQVLARYILSTKLMQLILDFRIKQNTSVHLSFVDSKLYIAIEKKRDLFEHSMTNESIDTAPVFEFYEDLKGIFGIIDEMDLNTRIWSKQ
jgi:hypothetical protein